MDAMEATELAACLEFEVGAACPSTRVECFAVPLSRGSSRRRSGWAFLLVTDAPERTVRETLPGYEIELIERRGKRRVMQAWPRGRQGRTF